jgi:hypothetical protein
VVHLAAAIVTLIAIGLIPTVTIAFAPEQILHKGAIVSPAGRKGVS